MSFDPKKIGLVPKKTGLDLKKIGLVPKKIGLDPKKIGLVPKSGDERSLRATEGSEAISQEIRLRLPRRAMTN